MVGLIYMKKYMFVSIIISVILSTGFVFAEKLFWESDHKLPKGYSQRIYSDILDSRKLDVVKFKDGNTICYIVSVPSNATGSYTPSMDCDIK